MDYGLTAAAGIQGGYETLDHLLQQRMQQEAIKRQVAQQQFENQRQLAGDQRAQQAQTIEQQRYAAQMAERQGAADAAQGDKLNESIPGDTRLDPNDRAVGFLRSAGVPLQPVPGVAAMGADFQGPMPNGVTPQQAQTGIGAGFLKTASAKQIDTEADNARQASTAQAGIDAKIEGLHQAAEHLRMQGEVNAANILRMQAEAAAANAKTNKPATVNLSPAAKSARAAIEQAAPLTDQVMEMIRKEAPDIETNPGKYNGVMSKLTSLGQTLKYKAGFHDDSDPRQQLVSLLQPIQAGQYTRSSRSRQMLDLALKHMADPSQTLLTQYKRAKELKAIMPEMLEGIVRAEQPVDPSNPLGGSYLDPRKGADATGTKPTAEDLIQKYGGR